MLPYYFQIITIYMLIYTFCELITRYLNQLGMTATMNHKVYCRQTLIGGNYGLLNTTSFIPNPDYYG